MYGDALEKEQVQTTHLICVKSILALCACSPNAYLQYNGDRTSHDGFSTITTLSDHCGSFSPREIASEGHRDIYPLSLIDIR